VAIKVYKKEYADLFSSIADTNYYAGSSVGEFALGSKLR
jgi:hypothetical protein